MFLRHVALGAQGLDQLLLRGLRSLACQALVDLLLALLTLLLSFVRNLEEMGGRLIIFQVGLIKITLLFFLLSILATAHFGYD